MTDELLAEQIAYYRARAPEYDEWWDRRGRYERGPAFERAWRGEVDTLRRWLDRLGPLGAVLELAAGTGNWTVELADRAEHVTAVDSSPETLALNEAKTAGARATVERVTADLFSWEPPRRWPTVFFSFWISHVPDERLPAFFSLVDRALEPGGRVVMIDNRDPKTADAEALREAGVVELPDAPVVDGRSHRELNDGRTFCIVKEFRSPERLAELLAPLGWRVSGAETPRFFTWAVAERA